MKRIVLASGNAGKLAELNALLADSGIAVVAQATLGVGDAEETGLSFVENALLKARHAAQLTGLPALADDSGLCVDALDGAPGLRSARYAGGHGDDQANNAKLLAAMQDVAVPRRQAHFHCCLVLLRHAHDPAPLIAEGRWSGSVGLAPRGEHGFGYDPLFIDAATQQTAAELDQATKNRLSHRAQAMTRLHQLLRTTLHQLPED